MTTRVPDSMTATVAPTHSTASINAELAKGGRIRFAPGTYTLTDTLVAGSNTWLDFDNVTLQTSADIPLLRFGAAAASNLAYSHGGFSGQLTLVGAGSGKSANQGIVVRNFSYGDFTGSVKLQNMGSHALYVTAYERGVQYNQFGGAWQFTGNHGKSLYIDPEGTGGYCNDNQFVGLRAHAHAATGVTVAHINGGGFNRFFGCGFETTSASDTLLRIEDGENNAFFGLRLDGVASSVALRLDAAALANWIFGYITDGTVTDTSGRNFFVGDQGTLSFPFLRFGSGSGNPGWDIKLERPGSTDELHIGAGHANGFVRFPNNTIVGVGNRAGGDNAPLELDATNKRLRVRTLPGTNIGSGAYLQFEGEFSASGDQGSINVYQDANGMAASFSQAGKMLYSGGALAVADAMTAPAAVAGRAIIYVDSADGDLKVKFADGVVKTLATDT